MRKRIYKVTFHHSSCSEYLPEIEKLRQEREAKANEKKRDNLAKLMKDMSLENVEAGR
jgi:hypothetical protein